MELLVTLLVFARPFNSMDACNDEMYDVLGSNDALASFSGTTTRDEEKLALAGRFFPSTLDRYWALVLG